MVIAGSALIFQILSMAGIASDTNVLVWTWGVGVGGIVVGVVYQILALLAMNKAYSLNSKSGATAQ